MADLNKLFQYDPGDGHLRFICPFAAEAALALAFADLGMSEEGARIMCASENPAQQAQGAKAVVDAAREAFDLVPFNGATGDGCSPASAWDVFWAFRAWGNQKKTTPASTPNSPASTEPASSNCHSIYATASG